MTEGTSRWAALRRMGTSRRMKLIFVMQTGAFKPQGSPCLKSSISVPPSGETFQTTHPVKKPTKNQKKT